MSIFLPYTPFEVLHTLEGWFEINLSNLTSFESVLLTLLANLYFFIFWGFILYFVLKSLNWVYERLC